MGEDGKIGLSMKLVNQGNGTDLDPNGIALQRDEQRRKTMVPGQKRVIELQAVFNTTCSRCGTKGHLAKECFTPPDGTKYELLPELEAEATIPLPEAPAPANPEKDEKKSKHKKLKKRKKSKKSKHKSECSSSDSSDEEERKKKKKKKKHSKEVKRKKRKHSESSSDESSDSIAKEKHSKKCKHSRSKHSD